MLAVSFFRVIMTFKMFLNKTYSKVQVGKHFCVTFPSQNGFKQRDILLPLARYKKTRRDLNLAEHLVCIDGIH